MIGLASADFVVTASSGTTCLKVFMPAGDSVSLTFGGFYYSICSSNSNAVEVFEAEIFSLFESKLRCPTNVRFRDRMLASSLD